MAVVRGKLSDCLVVLASATPSIETLANVKAGRYHEVHLPDRHAGALMPEIRVIDMRKTPPQRRRWLAPPLVEALRETLAKGEQSMLFLNRRGYAPLTLCRSCGYRLQCPHCTAWLVEHRSQNRLICHHCGHFANLPRLCPECQNEDSFVACGPGVERVAEEVSMLFPEARMAVMASDTITSPKAAAELVRQVSEREIDILVGTQIMAKGHHFPLLTLVGVVDADLGLAGGDLRAAERTFQMLSQVAGRAGRGERSGVVMLQSFDPYHPVLQAIAAQDRDGFIAAEAEARQASMMPPDGRSARGSRY
jgi:primosomal protein N' (replication factor Y)